jgi:hypothetical protein
LFLLPNPLQFWQTIQYLEGGFWLPLFDGTLAPGVLTDLVTNERDMFMVVCVPIILSSYLLLPPFFFRCLPSWFFAGLAQGYWEWKREREWMGFLQQFHLVIM